MGQKHRSDGRDQATTLVILVLVLALELGIVFSRRSAGIAFDSVSKTFLALALACLPFLFLRQDWARLTLAFVLSGQSLGVLLAWAREGSLGIGLLLWALTLLAGLVIGSVRAVRDYAVSGSINNPLLRSVAPAALVIALGLFDVVDTIRLMTSEQAGVATSMTMFVAGIGTVVGLCFAGVVRPVVQLLTGSE